MQPKISIIIPVYNVEPYLSRCIDSVLNQSFSNFELILINDGSTDQSGDICDEYAVKDNRVRVVHQPNSGVSVARNYGIRLAKGDFITFIDGDDYVETDLLKVLYELVIENQCDMAMCSYKLIYDDKIIDSGTNQWRMYDNKEACELFFCDQKPFAPSYTWGRIIKRNLFENIKFREDVFLMEDTLLNTEIMLKCDNGIIVTEQTLYNYVQRDGSASNSFNGRRITSFYALEELLKLAKSVSPVYEQRFLKVYAKLNLGILQDIIKYGFNDYKESYIEISKGLNQKFLKIMKSSSISRKNKIHLLILKFNPYLYKHIVGLV